MLIRKDDTILNPGSRPSIRSADIGDPFAIKFIGRDFEAIFPYYRLSEARIRDDILTFVFDNGTSIECVGSNLRAILDSSCTARLQLVEESCDYMRENYALMDGEIVVEKLRYCQRDEPQA
jgi:hypothetical protein